MPTYSDGVRAETANGGGGESQEKSKGWGDSPHQLKPKACKGDLKNEYLIVYALINVQIQLIVMQASSSSVSSRDLCSVAQSRGWAADGGSVPRIYALFFH